MPILTSTPPFAGTQIGDKTLMANMFSGLTNEGKITTAIARAVQLNASFVYVPANMLPYDASKVTFNTAVKMVCEGGDFRSYNVKAYGAHADNATDDFSSFSNAILGARANRSSVYAPGSPLAYITSASLVLGSNTLSYVPLLGDGSNVLGPETQITGNFAGSVLKVAGIAGPVFVNAGLVSNISFKQLNAAGSCVDLSYSSLAYFEDCEFEVVGGLVFTSSNFCISMELHNCRAYGSQGTLGGSKFMSGVFYNTKVFGGRALNFDYIFEITAESLACYGFDAELSRVFLHHGSFKGGWFYGCHIETTDVIVTNAYSMPPQVAQNGLTTPWVDQGGNGAGLAGSSILFSGCYFLCLRTMTDHVVLKTEAFYGYKLKFSDCVFDGGMTLRCNNVFTYNTNAQLPQATSLEFERYAGTVQFNNPIETYSKYKNETERRYLMSEFGIPSGNALMTDANDGASGNAYTQLSRAAGYKASLNIAPVAGEPHPSYNGEGNIAQDTVRGLLFFSGGAYYTGAIPRSAAMPSSGLYRQGDIVLKTGLVEAGAAASKYVLIGWARLTTSTNHVLNTDWLEMRCLTGN